MIPNAVDLRAIDRARLDGSPPTIVSVGRLVLPKSFWILGEALRALEPGSFRALVVGDGP